MGKYPNFILANGNALYCKLSGLDKYTIYIINGDGISLDVINTYDEVIIINKRSDVREFNDILEINKHVEAYNAQEEEDEDLQEEDDE